MANNNAGLDARFTAGHLEILARLQRLKDPVILTSLMSCDYPTLKDLEKRGLVYKKTQENMTTYELSIRGKRYISNAVTELDHCLWHEQTD